MDDNDVLMYLTHNESKSVAGESFKKKLKVKTYKNYECNSFSYLDYLEKLVDVYNNSYHHFIGKKPIDADCSDLIENTYQY